MKRLLLLLSSVCGFSLVELSVVLIVIGITLGSGLTILTQKTENDKIEETEAKMDAIEEALIRYMHENYRLPCIADITLDIDNTDFGVDEGIDFEGCQAGVGWWDGLRLFYGTVPTKTLNLPDEYMFDAWGNRFGYAIDFHFAHSSVYSPISTPPTPIPAGTNYSCNDTGGGNDRCFIYRDSGTYVVNDGNGNPRTTEAVYVLISHGPNGHGGYPRDVDSSIVTTGLDTGSTDTDELENSEYSINYDNTFVQKAPTTTFDDIVRYKLRWQLVDEANSITDESLCTAAAATNSFSPLSGNNPCVGATDQALCEEMGEKYVVTWCFNIPID